MSEVLVCHVGGKPYYGNEFEAVVARLNEGDRVNYTMRNGRSGTATVDYVWFYEGPICDVIGDDGERFGLHPSLGDRVELASASAVEAEKEDQ